MFKVGDLVETNPEDLWSNDHRIQEVEKCIGPAPWKIKEITNDYIGQLLHLEGLSGGLEVIWFADSRFKLFVPANKEPIDNWKNGLDLL